MVRTENWIDERLRTLIDCNDHCGVLALLKEFFDNRPARVGYDKPLLIYYLQTAGFAAQKCEETDLARRYYEEALFLLRSLHARGQRSPELARLLHRLGDTHLQRKEPEIACAYLRESAFWLEHDHQLQEAMHVCLDIGQIALKREDYEEARTYFRRCHEYATDEGMNFHRITALKYLVKTALAQNAQDSARFFYEDAIRVIEETQDEALDVATVSNADDIAQMLEDWETSERLGRRALALAAAEEDARTAEFTLSNLAFALYRMEREGSLSEVAELLNKAIDLARCRNNRSAEAHYHRRLGHLYLKYKHPSEAISSYQIALCMDNEDQRTEGHIHDLLCIAYQLYALRHYTVAARLLGFVLAHARSAEAQTVLGYWGRSIIKWLNRQLRPWTLWIFLGRRLSAAQAIQLAIEPY